MRWFLMLALLILPSVGCEKKAKKTESESGTQSSSFQPGGGAVQNVRNAAVRTQVKNELHQMRTFIEFAYQGSGKMPTGQETYTALQKEAPTIAKMIDDKVITLVPMPQREGVWAYETAALQSSGQVLSNQGIEQMDAATLKQNLGR